MTKRTLSRQESGALGEQIIIAHLKSQGKTDAASLNVRGNNFPVDLVHDHELIEVKTGLVSNGKSAQQWRATIGQPGKAETKWLKSASAEEKAAWNMRKQQAIIERKNAALQNYVKSSGHKVTGKTMAVILNPDSGKADLFMFDGFHARISWNSELARNGYVGTVSYKHRS